MFTKKFYTAVMLWASVAIPLWACTSYNIEVVEQVGQQWRFQHLMAYEREEGTRVRGRLTASHVIALPRGHVDIAAYTSTGELIEAATTTYTPSRLTRRAKRKGGVRFSADLTEKLLPESIVKIAFHRDGPHPKLSPTHTGNIAR